MLTTEDFLIPNHKPGSVKTSQGRQVFAIPTFGGAIPAAGTYYVDLAGVFKPGTTNIGAFIQSSTAVVVSITMASVDEVIRNEAGVPWTTDINVPADDITPIVNVDGVPLAGSVMKITATDKARIYIGSL